VSARRVDAHGADFWHFFSGAGFGTDLLALALGTWSLL
jgi:hypothetical protein